MLHSSFMRRLRPARGESGFTLLELLIVVIVIGILAAIAIPVFLNQQRAAHDASVQSDVRNTVPQVFGVLALNGGKGFDAAARGVDGQSDDVTGDYVERGGKIVSSKGDTVQVTMTADGCYKVAGWRTEGDGNKFKDSTSAFIIDSCTGKAGTGPAVSLLTGQDAVDYPGGYYKDATFNDEQQQALDESSLTLYGGSYFGEKGFKALGGTIPTLKGLTPWGPDNPNGTGIDYISQQRAPLAVDNVKLYAKDGSLTTTTSSSCYIASYYLTQQGYAALSGGGVVSQNIAAVQFSCYSTTGGTENIANSLKGGHITFSTAEGAGNVAITGTVHWTGAVAPAPADETLSSYDLESMVVGVPVSNKGVACGCTIKGDAQGGYDHEFSIVAGSLPPGVNLGSVVGLFAGTPTGTETKSYTYTVKMLNKNTNKAVTKEFTTTVHMPAKFAYDTETLTVNQNSPSSIPSAAVKYGEPTVNYTLAKDTYPAGASDTTYKVSNAGLVTGTPTVPGTYKFQVGAYNGWGDVAIRKFVITVQPAVGNGTYSLTTFENGQDVSETAPFTVAYANADYSGSSGISVSTEQGYNSSAHSLKTLPTSGGYAMSGRVKVTVSNVTVGKKYQLAGYYKTANNSNNTGSYKASVEASTGLDTSYTAAAGTCQGGSIVTGSGVAKNTWNSFLGGACTATSSTITFYVYVQPTINGYTGNGFYYDNFLIVQS